MSEEKHTHLLGNAKKALDDLFVPSPLIYWVDLFFSATLGWAAFVVIVRSHSFSFATLFCWLVAVFCLYRAAIFIHELAHLRKGSFRLFRIVWNIFCGFPLTIPSFFYRGVHIDHHKQKIYGTQHDGEYVPFVLLGRWRIVAFFLSMFVVPLLFLIRFLLTPVSYCIPPLRKFLLEHLSSLAITPHWKRSFADNNDQEWWRLQEAMTFLYIAVAGILIATHLLPLKVLFVWYAVMVCILLLNGLRTMAGTHTYHNPGNQVLGFSEQFLDSVTVLGNPWIASLWAPVGLQYHSLHHLFPGMPYHNLGRAHRRLMKISPLDSPYYLTLRPNLYQAFMRLWREARATSGTLEASQLDT